VANLQVKKQQLRRIRQMVDQGLEILSSACDLDEFGHLMDQAWEYKRSLSDLVSNSEIDQIYQMAKTHGALGGKLLGAGSSGFMLFYVPEEFQEEFKTAMASLLHIPFHFESNGSTILHHSQ
jgi:D-glycero-alpha-D-manno-heptose-7-phosphate kinase